ncbi:dna helicase pif1, atp-dependent [Ophiocordyceps camponoti-floridani]|uniref:Dna helicase pif1, atp-dependent n=1 Tax=Ophiocordyceps camponoti-floridani TaxID=2030778 RepID=A0A8H4Q9J2_9HYPO|nr:dna helicase pif1, atp-dependent [Ophiocordyceps camponoti-floridani]
MNQHVPLSRPRYHVAEISDIRNEVVTEERARRLLSTYIVMRMLKYECLNEIDDNGCLSRPTWQRVRRILESGISQVDAIRRVQELNGSESVCLKKSKLGPSVQRQLEMAQQDLEAEDLDPRYEHVIAQLDSQVKKVPVTDPVANKGKNFKSKHRYKNERISVTVFFKRAPRSGENALQMLEERNKARQAQPAVAPVQRPMPPPMSPPMPWTQPPECHLPAVPTPPPPPPQTPLGVGSVPPGLFRPDTSRPKEARGRGLRVSGGGTTDATSHGTSDWSRQRNSSPSSASSVGWDSDHSGYTTPISSVCSSSQHSTEGCFGTRNRSRHRHHHHHHHHHHHRHHHHRQHAQHRHQPERFRQDTETRRHNRVNADRPPSRSCSGERRRHNRPWEDEVVPGEARRVPLRPRVVQVTMPGVRTVPEYEARRDIADDVDEMERRLEQYRLEDEARMLRRRLAYRREGLVQDPFSRNRGDGEAWQPHTYESRYRMDLHDEPVPEPARYRTRAEEAEREERRWGRRPYGPRFGL